MSEFVGDVVGAGASLQGPLLNAPRKRYREENYAIDANLRRVPQHVRVQVACENTTCFVSLRGHVLDAQGRFNSVEFPGLAFFYNPVVACVASGTITLHFDSSNTVTERILHEHWRPPCPIHGPFRCACYTMHKVADEVAQLLREIFCQDAPFDVSIDCLRPYPHIRIDSQTRTWSVSLVGLPLPPKAFGPFPLGTVTSPQSIKNHWFLYSEKSRVVGSACIMCGSGSVMECARCLCLLCTGCGEHCGACGRYICRGCSSAGESGMTICYNCPL
ncbi:hypothetical protein, conserved [Leishmania lindenbergi]|uniref:Uncharacterized protein n=1 Tax=Leishmania lindenbergi TaxID=651832 RepID=A0AAW3AWJ6_9TRYP